MDAPIKKCTDCGIDLNGQKRVKDASGSYSCPGCWDAKAKRVNQRAVAPKRPSAEIPVPQRLRAAAEQLVKQFAEGKVANLTFDLEGVRWVDGYINRNRRGFPRGERERLVSYLGAFVGECIIAIHGGQWALAEHAVWGVQATKHVWCDPRSKVEKHFDNDQGQSSAYFVEFIPTLEDHLESGTPLPPQCVKRDPRSIPKPN
jgi:hypothetical protein